MSVFTAFLYFYRVILGKKRLLKHYASLCLLIWPRYGTGSIVQPRKEWVDDVAICSTFGCVAILLSANTITHCESRCHFKSRSSAANKLMHAEMRYHAKPETGNARILHAAQLRRRPEIERHLGSWFPAAQHETMANTQLCYLLDWCWVWVLRRWLARWRGVGCWCWSWCWNAVWLSHSWDARPDKYDRTGLVMCADNNFSNVYRGFLTDWFLS